MTMHSMPAADVAADRGVRPDGRIAPGALIDVSPVRPPERTSRLARISDTTSLVLLLMAAAVLLFRPSDLLPSMRGAPIYELLMMGCLATGAPALIAHLSSSAFRRNGVILLLILFVPAVMLSHLASANTWDARMSGGEMLKACTLSVLVVTLVDTPLKLRRLFTAVIAAVIAVTSLSILHYHGVLHVPALASIEQNMPDGEEAILRLCGIGVFNDPNDFSLLLVISMAICVYGIVEAEGVFVRAALVAPLLLFAYGLHLTHSRGGMLAAVATGLAFLQGRLGWRNTILIAVLVLPPIALLATGRQASLNLEDPEDTFQLRLQLWRDAFDAFWYAPVFGIGTGKLVDRFGAVAHNSYVQAFSEMGFVGGTIFVGAFFLAIRGLVASRPTDLTAARMRACMLAIVVGYAAGLLSLSRCYTVPTQLVLAIAATHLAIGRSAIPALDFRAIRTLAAVSLFALAGTYLFLRVMIR